MKYQPLGDFSCCIFILRNCGYFMIYQIHVYQNLVSNLHHIIKKKSTAQHCFRNLDNLIFLPQVINRPMIKTISPAYQENYRLILQSLHHCYHSCCNNDYFVRQKRSSRYVIFGMQPTYLPPIPNQQK